MLRPPKTNDPALNRFLEEVASTIQDRVRPEEGWTLSDFASSVSEVISDKRDLIDIVTKYDNIEGLSEEMEAAVDLLKSDIQDSMDLLSSVNSKSAEFAEVMEWWDQNYKVIFDAQEAMEIFGEISSALEGHQDILDQIAAATGVAENLVAEIQATEEAVNAAVEAAKASEINATDAAVRAETSETEAGQSAAAAAASASAAQASETTAGDSATAAKESETAAATSASTAAADAGRAESAAAGVDQVVSDAAGVLRIEVTDDLAVSQAARSGAEAARDEAQTHASNADIAAQAAESHAGDAATSATLAGQHSTNAEASEATAGASRDSASQSALAAQSARDEAQSVAEATATAAAETAARAAIADLVGSAPAELDTVHELAAAIKSNQGGIGAINTALGNRVRGDFEIRVSENIPPVGTPSNVITFRTPL